MRKNDTRKLNVKSIIIRAITLLAVLGLYVFVTQYFFLTPINVHSVGFWFVALFFLGIVAAFFYGFYCYDFDYDYDDHTGVRTQTKINHWVFRIALILCIVCALVLIVAGIGGSKLFHAEAYSNLITIEDGDVEADIPGSKDTLVVVDKKTAEKLGDRQVAYLPNSTYYEVSDSYTLVRVGDEYVRVTPVNYGGLFKAGKAGSIPGFIQVEATNTGNEQSATAKMYEEAMTYSPSAYWSHDLYRHLHMMYPTYMLCDTHFEVDDSGVPYWITTVNTNTIWLFGGTVEKTILVTNAVNGETQEYVVEEAPEWIDHIHSVSYLLDRVGMHYKYRNGYMNAIFSKTDVYNTSYSYRDTSTKKDENDYTPFEGYNVVIGRDGQIWIYTGITPANNAESNIGFVLVNPRTAEARFYPATGAEESSAQHAAEGLVQNLRYSANFPTVIQIDGKFAYFMSLKDDAGLVQRYAICNVENYSKVVEANTIDKAIEKYMAANGNPDYMAEPVEEVELQELTGKVSRVETAQMDGDTYFFFTLEGENDVYVSSIKNSSLQPMKLANSVTVAIEYYASTEEGIMIVTQVNFK